MKKKTLVDIERSLIKTYRKDIWSKFIASIQNYKLIDDGDKIAVAISGGKDSLIMAKLLQELQKHNNRNFDLEFIAMDPGYTKENRRKLEELCEYLGIDVKIYNSDIFEVRDEIGGKYPCYICARMRRGFLYNRAEELACNKLALGHHFNDVIETTMLNILCSGSYKTMMPKLKAENFSNMELIRPIYMVKEKDIIRWQEYASIEALDCACSLASKKISSKRFEIKNLIEELGDSFDNVDMSIFRSAENVNLDGVISWKEDGEKYSFLDEY